ncbi:LysR family transcriptional regulator [Pantoea dispersa]|uniref:LysR family transcriptional regulator n=1 Tax=Pantoea dispersa TaxID=59814 RepID=UPI0032B4F6E7
MESKVSQSGNNANNRGDNAVLALSNIDLKLLRVFKCVVEAGGLTAASHELNIGLAAISKQVSDLEIRLGMTLCSRGREGFELTQYGINVYQATLELFVSLNLFRERLHNSRNELLGDIAICVVDNTISDPHSPVTSAVQQLHQKAPKVQIRLQTAQLDDIERGISEGRFHCGIAPVYEMKNEFDYFELYKEYAKLYCAASHPLYCGSCDKNISVDVLRQQKIINHLYVTPRDERRLIPVQESGVQAVQVESVAMLILTGQFIGYLPEHYAAPFIARGQLCELGDDTLRRETAFCLVMKKGRKINPIIRLFMQALGLSDAAAAP